MLANSSTESFHEHYMDITTGRRALHTPGSRGGTGRHDTITGGSRTEGSHISSFSSCEPKFKTFLVIEDRICLSFSPYQERDKRASEARRIIMRLRED